MALMQSKQRNNSKQKLSPVKPMKSQAGSKRGPKQASVAAAYATTSVGRAPTIKASRDTCNIKHRELLSSVIGSANFTVANSFSMNPGLASSFPWLSIMAQGWEEYRFKSLRYCYMTRTGSTTPGSVMMAPDYDAADAPPATEQIASSYSQVVEDAPWKDICCVIKTANLQGTGKRHFVRSGPLADNLDVKTYDVGTLHLCTVDGTVIPWGKLWVEYDIDFYIPALPSLGASSLQGGSFSSGGTVSLANPFGNAPDADPQNSGVLMDNGSLFTFQSAGDYLMSFQAQGVGLTALNVTNAGGVIGISQLTVINPAGTVALTRVTASASAAATLYFSATGTSLASSELYVAKVPTGSAS